MENTKPNELKKVLLHFSYLILAAEIYYWEEILANIKTIDASNFFTAAILYSTIKGFIVFGIYEYFKDKLVRRFHYPRRFFRKITVIRLKTLKIMRLKDRWERYNLFEKAIIFFAVFQLVVAIVGALLFYAPTRRQTVKLTQKKIGRKLFIVIFAFLPAHYVINNLYPKWQSFIKKEKKETI